MLQSALSTHTPADISARASAVPKRDFAPTGPAYVPHAGGKHKLFSSSTPAPAASRSLTSTPSHTSALTAGGAPSGSLLARMALVRAGVARPPEPHFLQASARAADNVPPLKRAKTEPAFDSQQHIHAHDHDHGHSRLHASDNEEEEGADCDGKDFAAVPAAAVQVVRVMDDGCAELQQARAEVCSFLFNFP